MTTAGTPPIDPAVAKYKADLEKWEKDEALALDLLTQCILDSTVVHTLTLKTTAAMWDEIICEYTEKGTMTQTDLHTRFLELKYSEKSDVHTFLDSLHVKREELVQARVQIDDKRLLLYHHQITPIPPLPLHLKSTYCCLPLLADQNY